MDTAAFSQFFGRLHPMVLHLPIGLLICLAFVEFVSIVRRKPVAREVSVLIAWLTAGSAVLAAGTGWVLHLEGVNTGPTVERHEQLGIALAVVSVLMAAGHHALRKPIAYRLLLVVALGLMVPAGHLGASMTHGSKFLTEPFAQRDDAPTGDSGEESDAGGGPSVSVFAARVEPVLAERCTACHGESRQKGGLALHTAEAILAGGDSGSVLVPGNAAASEIVRRLHLPLDHDDHMPPEGKPQPTAEEIAAIEEWIAEGASFDTLVPHDAPAETIPDTGIVERLPPPDPEALAALQAAFVHYEPLAEGSNRLNVSFGAVAAKTDDALAVPLLEPLLIHIRDLSLGRSQIGDETVSMLADAKNLLRLDLSGTQVTDEGVAQLAGHDSLEELVLARTGVTDAVIEHLTAMPALRRVFLWDTDLTDEGVVSLREARPELSVDAGDAPEAVAEVVEPDLEFTSDLPLPGEEPKTVSLEPVNTVCPVSGEPVDPRYVIVHEKQVIGFCCPKCPSTFWADPEKFLAKLKPAEPANEKPADAPAETEPQPERAD